MRWYLIFDMDFFADTSEQMIESMKPDHGHWVQSEGDEEYDLDYLGDEIGGANGERYKNGRHRKWIAELSDEEMRKVEEHDLLIDIDTDSREPTMGAITENGHLPAFAINFDGMEWNAGGVTPVITASVYICPLPESDEDLTRANELLGEDAWSKPQEAQN